MCGEHAAVRGVMEHLPVDEVVMIFDMGASPEPFSRGTMAPVQRLVLVTEPSYKSLEASRRLFELGTGLGIPEIGMIANKVASDDYREAIEEFAQRNGIPVWGMIPYDEAFAIADVKGVSPLDMNGEGSPGIEALDALAGTLVSPEAMTEARPGSGAGYEEKRA